MVQTNAPGLAHPSFPGTFVGLGESHRSFDVPDVFCSSPRKEVMDSASVVSVLLWKLEQDVEAGLHEDTWHTVSLMKLFIERKEL